MDNKDLQLLHNKILEIAEYFDAFCKQNGITYYLMGGTALGAIRHAGFIPWDDDFDVFMDRENYLKFISIADNHLDKKNYYLQQEDTDEWPLYFSKLRMNNTTFIEKDVRGREMHHGIYIDVMCLNNAADSIIIRYIQYFAARMLNTRALSKRGYDTQSPIKKFFMIFSDYIVFKQLKYFLLYMVRFLNNKKTKYIGHFFGRAPFLKTSFKNSYLGKARYVKFEHLLLPVPEKVEKYLNIRFGSNYMSLPSEEEKMKYPSHAYIVDTNKSYTKYIK